MHGVLRAGAETWAAVREHLFGSPDERMAYLLARAGVWTDAWGVDTVDLLVTRAVPVPDEALRLQTGVRVEIDDAFTREILVACYETGLSLVDVHTHPFSTDTVAFSGHDVTNMRITHAEFLAGMPPHPPRAAASLVLGRRAVAGAFTGPDGGDLHPLTRFELLGDHLEAAIL
jgi:hypothetical protein